MNCHNCSQNCWSESRKKGWKRFGFRPKTLTETCFVTSNKTIALVGSPNVGKSLLFNLLTGTYVTVANYPGTTVEVAQGNALIAGEKVTFFDTPGMYSLIPMTEEERVARDLVFHQPLDLVIHVIDAKHLGRMLNLTLQLLESQLPVLLVVNMMDEARQLGIGVDAHTLIYQLGIPVVTVSATQKIGIKQLIAEVADYVQPTPVSIPC